MSDTRALAAYVIHVALPSFSVPQLDVLKDVSELIGVHPGGRTNGVVRARRAVTVPAKSEVEVGIEVELARDAIFW